MALGSAVIFSWIGDMSDTEDSVQAKRRSMSDSSSASSADEDSSNMAKKPQELDNSGFRVDGEPMNKPRKVRPQNTVSQISYHIKMSPVWLA